MSSLSSWQNQILGLVFATILAKSHLGTSLRYALGKITPWVLSSLRSWQNHALGLVFVRSWQNQTLGLVFAKLLAKSDLGPSLRYALGKNHILGLVFAKLLAKSDLGSSLRCTLDKTRPENKAQSKTLPHLKTRLYELLNICNFSRFKKVRNITQVHRGAHFQRERGRASTVTHR